MRTILSLLVEVAETLLEIGFLLALVSPILVGCLFGALASLANR